MGIYFLGYEMEFDRRNDGGRWEAEQSSRRKYLPVHYIIPLIASDFYIVERVPLIRRPVENFRRDMFLVGGVLSFSVRLPQVSPSGFNQANSTHI